MHTLKAPLAALALLAAALLTLPAHAHEPANPIVGSWQTADQKITLILNAEPGSEDKYIGVLYRVTDAVQAYAMLLGSDDLKGTHGNLYDPGQPARPFEIKVANGQLTLTFYDNNQTLIFIPVKPN
ncbi:MAG: hypothetical protein AAF750_12330 [Planctomycetota bacterium]